MKPTKSLSSLRVIPVLHSHCRPPHHTAQSFLKTIFGVILLSMLIVKVLVLTAEMFQAGILHRCIDYIFR